MSSPMHVHTQSPTHCFTTIFSSKSQHMAPSPAAGSSHTHLPGIWMSQGHKWKSARCTDTERSCPCRQRWALWTLEQISATQNGDGRNLRHTPAQRQEKKTTLNSIFLLLETHQNPDLIEILRDGYINTLLNTHNSSDPHNGHFSRQQLTALHFAHIHTFRRYSLQ